MNLGHALVLAVAAALAMPAAVPTIAAVDVPESEAQDLAADVASTPLVTTPSDGGENVSVSGITVDNEHSATIAINPRQPRNVVVVGFKPPGCAYYSSRDGGETWSVAHPLPVRGPGERCLSPMVRASPDGRFFYITYTTLVDTTFSGDVVVFRLAGDLSGGADTVAAPRGANNLVWDRPWVGVHKFSTKRTALTAVYLTWRELKATLSTSERTCTIWFTRSLDGGETWEPKRELAGRSGCTDGISLPAPLVDGPRVVGGTAGHVLACWYDSADDGWRAGGGGSDFSIDCSASMDFGATFGPVFTAASDEHELPFALCPANQHHRIWPSVFPSLEIGADGSAHIVYAADPTDPGDDPECGDIRYVRHPGPPYDSGTWSDPVTVGADALGTPQYFPAITASKNAAGSCDLHLAYLGHEASPRTNLLYDVFVRTSTDCGETWGPVRRLTDESSRSRSPSLTNLIDNAITPTGTRQIVVWPDLRASGVTDGRDTDLFVGRG